MKPPKSNIICTLLLTPLATLIACNNAQPEIKPNVVIIFTDDLGFGDLSCYGNTKVTTPFIDGLAGKGILFTDAHTTSGVCTPSRYSLLTGRYCWRTFLKRNVIANGPALIEPGETTLASIFKEKGYETAVFGKWHIGHTSNRNVDYNQQPVPKNANDIGFTYSFTLPVGHFYPPYIYLENGRVLNYDPADPLTLEGNKQIGGKSYSYDPHDVTPELVNRSLKYMTEHRDKPFFLFLSLPNVHDPLTPSKAFSGNSVGLYGDYIDEMDWAVGEVLGKLKDLGLEENTIVIFTSDNGASEPNSRDVKDFYNPNHPLRGDKGDLYEGGHRIPFIIRWPGHTPAGTVSDEFIIFTDLLVTFADIINRDLGENEAADGNNILAALKGKKNVLPDRPMVIQSRNGMYGLRQGDWMYLHGPGNGDERNQKYAKPKEKITNGQLFNLKEDLHQDHNLADQIPERVENMRLELERIVGNDAD